MMILFVFFVFLMNGSFVQSQDLGTFGETFSIIEKDLLEHIQETLQHRERSGELKDHQQRVQERIQKDITHPHALTSITPARKAREWTFDPTITVTHDIVDHQGQRFAQKGDRLNPLDHVRFSKPFLFIDGDNEQHVQWALKQIHNPHLNGHDFSKIILVKGSPLTLQTRLKRDIFFDQQGTLTQKFQIQHVPAVVFQKEGDKVLTVKEEVVGDVS